MAAVCGCLHSAQILESILDRARRRTTSPRGELRNFQCCSLYWLPEKTNKVKDDFIRFLLDAKRDGKTVAAYGAAAKGNTLMNYAGIRRISFHL